MNRRELHKWKYNNVRSNELNRDVQMVIQGQCGDVEQINTTNIDPDPPVHRAKKVKGSYLFQRLKFDKTDRQIIFFGLRSHVDKSIEQ